MKAPLPINVLLISCFLLMSSLVSGCSSTPPRTDYALDFDFSKLNNFSILPPVPGDNKLSAERIANQIRRDLRAKGFDEYPRSPDFLVGYQINNQNKSAANKTTIAVGAGTLGGNVGMSTQVKVPVSKNTSEQQIDIRIYDQSRHLIWRGTDSFASQDDPREQAKDAMQTVNKIMAHFPPTPSLSNSSGGAN